MSGYEERVKKQALIKQIAMDCRLLSKFSLLPMGFRFVKQSNGHQKGRVQVICSHDGVIKV